MECSICGGDLIYLGGLGSVDWFRCRNCGDEVMLTDATDDEIIAEYTSTDDEDIEIVNAQYTDATTLRGV